MKKLMIGLVAAVAMVGCCTQPCDGIKDSGTTYMADAHLGGLFRRHRAIRRVCVGARRGSAVSVGRGKRLGGQGLSLVFRFGRRTGHDRSPQARGASRVLQASPARRRSNRQSVFIASRAAQGEDLAEGAFGWRRRGVSRAAGQGLFPCAKRLEGLARRDCAQAGSRDPSQSANREYTG